ncbi:phage holin family protein [Lutibacter maritimus]|uniref:Bacteriophage holin family protein n=1 Tax=Lutibacter maritimus TaxID=593133 RepID=A0A1I6NS89_9FLAO|nr:phage holin family protein [Lutibacter maritimus]SFS30882.1 Bacteriophage holin family protein [Lutibacter maritimus]
MKFITLIYTFIASNLALIHKGTFLVKLKSSASLAIALSPIAYVTEKITHWAFDNQEYVMFVFIAIAIDHLLGSILHLIKRDFSLKKNITGLITKIGLVVAVGFLFEGVNAIAKDDSFIKEYLVIVLRLTVFMYPAGSAFYNSSILTKGKFPPIGWMNKLKKFEENLDLKNFKE